MKATLRLKSFIVQSLLAGGVFLLGGNCFAQPQAGFSATTTTGCAPILVQFTDESIGQPTQWQWDLGNGTISYLQNPSVTYFVPGNYTIKLVVKNANGHDSLVRTSYVQVYAAPQVNFAGTQTAGCDSLPVSFLEICAGSTSWQWDFGDGFFSTDRNPVHRYLQAGIYNVSLKAISGEGCALTLVKPAYISVNRVAAGFRHDIPNNCIPNRIGFQNSSQGTGRVTYKWLFGNGDSSTLAAPIYVYPSPGTYRVRLIASNEFGCVDTATSELEVTEKVSAAFSSNIIKSCTAPALVNFTSQALPNNNYTWSFGDSVFSSQSNPQHVYTDTGSFTVKLVVRNSNGCADSIEILHYIKIQKPFVQLHNLPDSNCTGFQKMLSASSIGSDSIVAYKWFLGDGATSTLANPQHTFTGNRYFTIGLITTGASGCTDTIQMQNAIHAGIKPMVAFDATSRIGCAQTGIEFSNHTEGDVSQWHWNFGDNAISSDQNPTHRFADTGFIDVELVAYNKGCADTLSKQGYVYIKPSVSTFKVDFGCNDPFRFSFTNLSVGADSWIWNFGDGNTSTELNPMHTFPDSGTYTVSLVTYNYTTGCEAYRSKGVIATKVATQLYASDTILCKGNEITFTANTDTAEITRYFWDFGDGIAEQTLTNSVSHQYHHPGNYTVKLITNNRVNCQDTIIKTEYISVKEVSAKFDIPDALVCYNTATEFVDSSYTSVGNSIQSWQWDFGDGTIAAFAQPPFSHSYRRAGNYTVQLSVTDIYGCQSSYASENPVSVKKIQPLFWPVDSVKCTGTDLKFICPYAEPGISYSWDFGDGTILQTTSSRPVHQYASEGLYKASLKVSHIAGCIDSFTLAQPVKIQNPVSRFSISDSLANCPPLIVQFTNQSAGTTEEVWNFGDGTIVTTHNPSHFYSYPGTYTASLTVRGAGGCTNTSTRTIVVQGPKGSLNYGPLQFCNAPALTTFTATTTDASSFIWDFNDGTTIHTRDSVITHQYNNTGSFTPKLMLVDSDGCKVPVQGIDTIHVLPAIAGFNFPDSIACNNGRVLFTNTSIVADSITNCQWNFGDGNMAQHATAPVHQYHSEGMYYPSLIITTAMGCRDSFVATNPVRISFLPDVNINASASEGCMPLQVLFAAVQNNNTAPVANWHWDFSNGNESNMQHPGEQVFTEAMAYPVNLTVTGTNGCKKIIQKNIAVHPLPAISITGNKSICKNDSTTLTATGAASWLWQSGNTDLSCTDSATIKVWPSATSNYIAKGTSVYGCMAYDTIQVTVSQPFKISVPGNLKICKGSNAIIPVSGADNYSWYPRDGLRIQNDGMFSVAPSVTTIYQVIGTNNNGCNSDTAKITVEVNALPGIDAGADKSIASGASVDLIPVLTNDVTEVVWSATGNNFRNTDNAISVKPVVTTEYIAKATNASGCSTTDKVKVIVSPDAATAQIFIPNTFSPNGDGMNDVFYPRFAGTKNIKRMKIMNRQGAVVFERNNFLANDLAAGWDGTCRGAKQPSDVYVYAIEIINADGAAIIIPGNFSLIR